MTLQYENSLIQIIITRRSNPNSIDYWDGNWLKTNIKIDVSGFRCNYNTNLRSDDFQRFHEKLIYFKNNLLKEVEFTTMEEGLYLKGKVELSNIKWEGIAKSDEGNILKVFFETDESIIEVLIFEIESILNNYPVIGI